MRRTLVISMVVVCYLICLCTARSAAAQTYTIAEIGTPCTWVPCSSRPTATGVNDAGVATGAYSIHDFAYGPENRALLWTAGTVMGLGPCPCGFAVWSTAINDSGAVVGFGADPDQVAPSRRAFLWQPDQGMQTLPTLGADTLAFAISPNGLIAGYARDGSVTAAESPAVVWDDGRLIRLTPGQALGINDAGQVVGFQTSTNRAALWDLSGNVQDLGTLGGSYSRATAISPSGQVVGVADTATSSHAFLWDPETGMQDLGTPPGISGSGANAISGPLIVGSADGRAFLYDARQGQMIDLNTQLPAGSGWVLTSANGVNAHGQIVGVGAHNGRTRGFVLTPNPSRQSVAWMNAVNVTATAGSLQKSDDCEGCQDAGATSQQQLTSGDGYVEFTASETTTIRGVALSHGNTDTSGADLDFAIALWKDDGWASVYEAGEYKADLGQYTTGDVFRIGVEDGLVKYSQNGVVGYTSDTPPAYPLLVDTTLWNDNATISNAVISGSALATSVVWSALANATASGNDLQKSGGCDGCADAGAISQQQIASGDGYVMFTAVDATTNRSAGLSSGNTDTSAADIYFAIALASDGTAAVYEAGAWQANLGAYAAGDVFRVAVEVGVVKYYRNATLVYTSTTAPAYPLLVDTSLSSVNATINNVVMAGIPQ